MKLLKCLVCSKPFKHRSNKMYCSDKCRYYAWAAAQEGKNVKSCYYCGLPASTIDHVPPRSVRPMLLEQSHYSWSFTEVDACYECNSWLGTKQPWDVVGRKAAVKEHLRKKYAYYLDIPNWSAQELADLGPSLLAHVTQSIILNKLTKQRLDW